MKKTGLIIGLISLFCCIISSATEYVTVSHKGVKFVLLLPKNKKEVNGVVIEGFSQSLSKSDLKGAFLSEYIQYAHSNGFAVISWETPVRSTSFVNYGFNSDDLSRKSYNVRKKDWSKLMAIINRGLKMLERKYDLPKNGYIAYGHCRGCNKVSRFVESYPERFSIFIGSKPLGMFRINKSTKHIYTYLICSQYNHPDSESSFKRFVVASHNANLGCSAVRIKNPKNLSRSKLAVLKYAHSLRTRNSFNSTLSNSQIEKMGEMIKMDLEKSDYAYDLMYRKWTKDGKSNLLGYKKYITTVPSKEIYEACLSLK